MFQSKDDIQRQLVLFLNVANRHRTSLDGEFLAGCVTHKLARLLLNIPVIIFVEMRLADIIKVILMFITSYVVMFPREV